MSVTFESMIAHSARSCVLFLALFTLVSCIPPTGILPTGSGGNSFVTGPVNLTVTTSTLNGSYAPRHVLALWVEDSNGAHVRTLGVWAAARKSHLNTWSGLGVAADGVTGATLGTHGSQTVHWDLKNKAGVVQPYGTYRLRGEMTESNSAGKTFSASITVVDATTAVAETTSSASGFPSIKVSYTP